MRDRSPVSSFELLVLSVLMGTLQLFAHAGGSIGGSDKESQIAILMLQY